METAKRFGLAAHPELTPGPTDESKLVLQMRSLKQSFGLGSLLGIIAMLISLGGIVYYQADINATSREGRKTADDTLRESTANWKAITDSLAGLRADVRLSSDITQRTQKDIEAMRQSSDTQMSEVRQKLDAQWAWTSKLENRIASLEVRQDVLMREQRAK